MSVSKAKVIRKDAEIGQVVFKISKINMFVARRHCCALRGRAVYQLAILEEMTFDVCAMIFLNGESGEEKALIRVAAVHKAQTIYQKVVILALLHHRARVP